MEKREYNWLDRVDSPRDLKRLSLDELRLYCDELRHYIIEQCAVNPGHLASSLGAVELAAAIHYVFDTPDDRLVWDVGHQAYAHKIITGRREAFRTNRKLGGISGFPRMFKTKTFKVSPLRIPAGSAYTARRPVDILRQCWKGFGACNTAPTSRSF